MPRGRPSPKIAITVDSDIYEHVFAAAEAAGLSVSAWFTEAAKEALLIEDGLRGVAKWEAENSPITDAEREAADRWVDELSAHNLTRK